MMHYKDMAFCTHSDECGNLECVRNLSREPKEEVEKSIAIGYANFKTETCGWAPVVPGVVGC